LQGDFSERHALISPRATHRSSWIARISAVVADFFGATRSAAQSASSLYAATTRAVVVIGSLVDSASRPRVGDAVVSRLTSRAD
jgi:hypothetical protein